MRSLTFPEDVKTFNNFSASAKVNNRENMLNLILHKMTAFQQ